MLVNYVDEIGWATANAWQDQYGRLDEGLRLIPFGTLRRPKRTSLVRKGRQAMPRRLFVFGGTNAIDNLEAVPLVEGLRLRGSIASQIRDLPDGTRISLKFY